MTTCSPRRSAVEELVRTVAVAIIAGCALALIQEVCGSEYVLLRPDPGRDLRRLQTRARLS